MRRRERRHEEPGGGCGDALQKRRWARLGWGGYVQSGSGVWAGSARRARGRTWPRKRRRRLIDNPRKWFCRMSS